MTEELTFDLPPVEGEPKPWTVRVWRFGSSRDEPFVTREDAVEAFLGYEDRDDCYAEGVFRPDGTLDEDAQPWYRKVDPDGPRVYMRGSEQVTEGSFTAEAGESTASVIERVGGEVTVE